MSNDFAFSRSVISEKDLLNPQINAGTDSFNGYMQAQWDLVRDGLWQGAGERKNQAQDNLLATGAEVASSAGIAAGLVTAFSAGGKWRVGAEIAGAALGALTGFDLYRRGAAIHDVYANSNSDAAGNFLRKNAIAQHAGSAIFDYSLILASAGLGTAASLHLNSRFSISTPSEAGLGKAANLGELKGTTLSERIEREQSEKPLKSLMDVEKVSDDLAYSLDYNISETAMSKISETLQKANQEDFNEILKKLEEKDRKFQGMDLLLGKWDEGAKRWDSVKLYYTDETMITHLIVQKNDTLASIAEQETKVIPRRTDKDIKDYVAALMNRNRMTDPNTSILPGQILVLPYAS